jgi:predicted ArsR family transcriptional regulator
MTVLQTYPTMTDVHKTQVRDHIDALISMGGLRERKPPGRKKRKG